MSILDFDFEKVGNSFADKSIGNGTDTRVVIILKMLIL